MDAGEEIVWQNLNLTIINLTEILPDQFSLESAYPNPFNPTVNIDFEIPEQSDINIKIFDLLGINEDESQRKFGFLMDAFRYGAPPHAGFAFGIDRLVALLVGEENIREVIAFPKSQSGTDPLTEAPTPIDAKQLDELGLRLLPPVT